MNQPGQLCVLCGVRPVHRGRHSVLCLRDAAEVDDAFRRITGARGRGRGVTLAELLERGIPLGPFPRRS